MQTKEENPTKSHQFHFYGGGKALIFSSDELCSYSSGDLQDQQYQFLRYIKKNDVQESVLNNDEVFLQCTTSYTCTKAYTQMRKKYIYLA